jgi:predicted AlkP superfamily phosphohydrolase/phosphomutase
MEEVDWPKTVAYANVRQCRDGVFVNLKGREPNGVVEPGPAYERVRDEVARAVRELWNPETGESVVERLWRREEVYSGPYLAEAPDLVFAVSGGGYLQDDRLGATDPIGPPPPGYGSYHRSPGIWAAGGPDIAPSGPDATADIVDLTPTVLHLLGLPVPREMDGRVLTDHLRRESVATRPVTYASAGEATRRRSPGYTAEEEREIAERLRDLGYLE